MSLTWLLDNACFDNNLPELKDELTRQGIKYVTGRYYPFGKGTKLDSKLPGGNVFLYGSLQFVNKNGWDIYCQSQGNTHINKMCNLPKFQCSYYYPRLSKFLFNQDHAFLPYGELIDKEEWVFDTFGVDDCVFMRPSSGFKEFTGQVYDKKYWKGMIELSNTQIQLEDLVVIARPQNILMEYRVIVGPNGPITSSITHKDGKLHAEKTIEIEENMVFEFVEKVLDECIYEPDPMFIIDVVIDSEYDLKVLEVNSMSCSGFYKCDLSKIVGAIKEYFV